MDFCITKFSPPVIGKGHFSAFFGQLNMRLHNFTGHFQTERLYDSVFEGSPPQEKEVENSME